MCHIVGLLEQQNFWKLRGKDYSKYLKKNENEHYYFYNETHKKYGEHYHEEGCEKGCPHKAVVIGEKQLHELAATVAELSAGCFHR